MGQHFANGEGLEDNSPGLKLVDSFDKYHVELYPEHEGYISNRLDAGAGHANQQN